MDSWGFSWNDRWSVSGLMRVRDAATANFIFEASSKLSQGHRLFSDVVGDKALISPASKVVWMDWAEVRLISFASSRQVHMGSL